MRAPALLALAALLASPPLAGQEWRVGAQLGRIEYNGALATDHQRPALVVGLSRVGFSDWLGFSAGLPLGEQQFWAAAGASKRLALWSRSLHLDLAAHGFAQRGPDTLSEGTLGPLPLPLPGEATTADGWLVRGAGAQAALVLSARRGGVQLEVRGGAAAQTSSIAGEATSDILPNADARLLLDLGEVQLGPEAQQWGGDVTYVGGTMRAARGPGIVWASAGNWVRGGPTAVTWSAGGGVEIGSGVRLDGTYRSPGHDPLYQSRTAGSVSFGASLRVGGASLLAAPVPAAYVNGRAVIRIRAKDVPGRPRIAGDFSNWKPLPMTAAGDVWTATIPLQPGVYSYAFVAEDGEWFVPESVPGRRSDGMGGWQAVLVIE